MLKQVQHDAVFEIALAISNPCDIHGALRGVPAEGVATNEVGAQGKAFPSLNHHGFAGAQPRLAKIAHQIAIFQATPVAPYLQNIHSHLKTCQYPVLFEPIRSIIFFLFKTEMTLSIVVFPTPTSFSSSGFVTFGLFLISERTFI